VIYFVLVFQQFLASTTHLVAQDVTQAVNPILVLFFRGSIASVVLLLLILPKWGRRIKILPQDRWRFVVLGILNVPLNQFLYLEGVGITSPANSALLYAMTPMFVFLLTLYIHRERASGKKMLGIVLALLGVVLIMIERGISLHQDYTEGNLLVFLAVITWSFYTFLGKPLVEKYGALRVTALNMTFGTLFFLPIAIASTGLGGIVDISPMSWARILYLGSISSVVNYLLWFYALGKLETSKVAIFQNLQPILTIIMALLLGRAMMTGQFVGGSVLALTGVLLVQLG
jgi:drug/metabolite transporter (DMT)-like permease